MRGRPPSAAAAGGPAPGARRSDPLARLRSSLLLKILGGLVVALVGSSVLTGYLEVRLTGDALAAQSRRLTSSNLRVLEQAYAERERTLVAALRNLGQSLVADGLLDAGRRNELLGRLGTEQRNLELDTLQVLDHAGRRLQPPAGAGDDLVGPATIAREDRRAPTSRLVPSADGGWLQAVMLPVGPGGLAPVLVGGYAFDDGFAYRLRGRLGELGHVVLVAGDRVVGTTLLDKTDVPPAAGPRGRLPTTPVLVAVGGVDTLVAYRTVGASGAVAGALGVSLADPEAALDRSLARTQLGTAAALAVVALVLGWLFFRALVRPLVTLKATAGRIAEGDLEASFEAAGSDEIAALARSLERMRRELRDQLDLIAQQAGALQDSSQRIVAAQDEERHRLARDLHDGIQQQLVVLRMGFGLVKEMAEREPGPVAPALARLSAELDAAIERLREVSHDLYPSILVDRGLAAALRTCLARLPLCARLSCVPEPLPRLPADVESGAYFLVGEALANALKHAAANEITVALEVSDSWLRVRVADDGRGFAAAAVPRTGGLLHMDDRTRSFGGDLRITSQPGGGTQVEATFPLRSPADVVPGP